MRALLLYTATWQDRVMVAEHEGRRDELAERVNDLLLPIVKGYGSERSWVVLGTECLQTFGGSGFLQDYALEQYVRDAKIDTLYEGTTAIQSLDLIFRKIVKDQGRALATLATEMQGFIETEAGNGQLKEERLALGKALGELQQILGVVMGWLSAAQGGDTRELYKVGLSSRRILLALGDAIEVSGLQEVFAADRTEGRPLVIGAVKTNVGHLIGAAGMAGLIKTVLVLQHGRIPANLHLSTPNPAIDWDACPTVLPDHTLAWPEGYPIQVRAAPRSTRTSSRRTRSPPWACRRSW